MFRSSFQLPAGLQPALLLLAVLCAALAAYWPGLSGPFLFDDFPNLSDLGLLGGVHDSATALRFVFSGHAGPLGRPLSLASFLINDCGWPSDPWGFKYTNLLIHILSALALLCALRQLRCPPFDEPKRRELVAVTVAGLWLLHPIQTAPVFLVVQRMTLLSGLFSLIGVALWLTGRNRLVDGRSGGWRWMTTGVVAMTVLAVLAKENGALLPMLLLVLERTLTPLPDTRAARFWRLIFLWLPSLAIAAYFVVTWPQIMAGYTGREFTLQKRLLTEPRILFDYLREIILPSITITIFRDDFVASDHATPASIAAIITLSAALITALASRRRWPWFSFAVLWFLAGHCLESGPIPLELYFIHRNYLPMIGVLLFIVVTTTLALQARPRLLALCLISLPLFSLLTYASSCYWGDEVKLIMAWADERPGSPRAAAMAADYWGQHRQFAKASEVIERTLALHPLAPSLQIGNYYEHCLAGTEDRKRWDDFVRTIPDAPLDVAMLDAMSVLIINIRGGDCKQINEMDTIDALDRFKQNPRYNDPVGRGLLDYSIAMMFLQLDDTQSAIGALEMAVQESPTVYEYELLGDLLAAEGNTTAAIDNYRHALDIPFFRGWRARLLGDEKPKFEVLERKLKILERGEARAQRSEAQTVPSAK